MRESAGKCLFRITNAGGLESAPTFFERGLSIDKYFCLCYNKFINSTQFKGFTKMKKFYSNRD